MVAIRPASGSNASVVNAVVDSAGAFARPQTWSPVMAALHGVAWFGLVLVAQVPAPPPQPIDPALKRDLTRLQGSWQLERVEENGKQTEADGLKGHLILFAGDHFILRTPSEEPQTGLLRLEVGRKPKTMNATILMGANRGTTMLGIYAFEKDALKICVDVQGEERPKEFTAPAKSTRRFMIYKRLRLKGEEESIAGTYRSVSSFGGKEQTADAVIERVGDAYLVKYSVNKVPAYIGIGLRQGDVFCMSWLNQGQVGVTLYKIEAGPRLVGSFTQLNAPGIVAEETLTRVQAEQCVPPE
jgi:uncharacterized protein (TIGR03067 family)